MDQVQTFLNDPLVAPLWGLLVLSLLDWLLGVYAAWSAGTFRWEESARVLRTNVLDRIVPLAAIGAASFLSPDTLDVGGVAVPVASALQVVYLGAAGLAAVAFLAGFREKWGVARMGKPTE